MDHALYLAMITSGLCHSTTVTGTEAFIEQGTRAGVSYLGGRLVNGEP